MVNFIIIIKFRLTPIAFSFLGLILILNVLFGVRSFGFDPIGAPASCPFSRFIFVCLIPGSFSFCFFFFVSDAIALVCCASAFWILGNGLLDAISDYLLVVFSINTLILLDGILVFLVMVFPVFFYSLFVRVVIFLVALVSLFPIVFDILSFGFPISFNVGFAVRSLAVSALATQSAFNTRIFLEIFKRGWKQTVTLTALFEGWVRGIIEAHKKFTFLVSRPRLLEQRWDNLLIPHIIPRFTPVERYNKLSNEVAI